MEPSRSGLTKFTSAAQGVEHPTRQRVRQSLTIKPVETLLHNEFLRGTSECVPVTIDMQAVWSTTRSVIRTPGCAAGWAAWDAECLTKEFLQVVLQGRASDEDAAGAAQGQQCIDGLVAGCCLEAVPLITHQQVHAASQCVCVLAQSFIRGHHHLPHRPCLEVQHLEPTSWKGIRAEKISWSWEYGINYNCLAFGRTSCQFLCDWKSSEP